MTKISPDPVTPADPVTPDLVKNGYQLSRKLFKGIILSL